jgi:hypothetical protein
MRRIEVAPLSDGWRVTVDGLANDMAFSSGREAEAAARRLAARLGSAGEPSELRIRLRDQTLAARQVWPAIPTSPPLADGVMAAA